MLTVIEQTQATVDDVLSALEERGLLRLDHDTFDRFELVFQLSHEIRQAESAQRGDAGTDYAATRL